MLFGVVNVDSFLRVQFNHAFQQFDSGWVEIVVFSFYFFEFWESRLYLMKDTLKNGRLVIYFQSYSLGVP